MKIRRRIAKPELVLADKLCNGKRRNGELCKKPAGAGTDHLGEGRCRRHGGLQSKRVVHGWYSQVTHARIREVLVELAKMDMNAMDLIPEANLLRAMTIDYV